MTRALLSDLEVDDFGDCLAEGIFENSLIDSDHPPPADGFGYLVQGQSFDCGLGPFGYSTDETRRINNSPGRCDGHDVIDARALSEQTVLGTVVGSFGDTFASDDVYETLTEEYIGVSRLDHRWTINVTPGRAVEFHVEAHRKWSGDGDEFAFEYSTDGGSAWIPIPLPSLPTADRHIDLVADLPPSLSGALLFRVVDTNQTSGGFFDWIAVDELFVRTIP
ncbi:MAG: hypothetical protein JSV80_07585 [Acidobacteriota bacterium]|nr:MAG: hypothetical protein JSV80_07585 [Acidobacteriota bacterium]